MKSKTVKYVCYFRKLLRKVLLPKSVNPELSGFEKLVVVPLDKINIYILFQQIVNHFTIFPTKSLSSP